MHIDSEITTRSHSWTLIMFTALLGCATSGPPSNPPPNQRLIVPSEGGGIYLGQTPFSASDVSAFETAIGNKVAFFFDIDVVIAEPGDDARPPTLEFDADRARQLDDAGYVFSVRAWEAIPEGSFTVDELLAGTYDAALTRFAAQLREFGKPMFFSTAREPNGVLADTMGGFGPDGDQGIGWAYENGLGLAEFDPAGIANPSVDGAALYAGLADDTICDGIERIAAAQRYYYDFFVNREGLDFLTFETTGWANSWADPAAPEDDPLQSCMEFANLYRGIAEYSDWVSINWYLITPPPELGETPVPRSDEFLIARLDDLMAEVQRVAPDKPVMFTEVGFCGETRGERARIGLDKILAEYPQIRAMVFWSETRDFPCGPIGDVAGELVNRITTNPGVFSSCARYSDGSVVDRCTEAPTGLVLPVTAGGCLAACAEEGTSTEEQCIARCLAP